MFSVNTPLHFKYAAKTALSNDNKQAVLGAPGILCKLAIVGYKKFLAMAKLNHIFLEIFLMKF